MGKDVNQWCINLPVPDQSPPSDPTGALPVYVQIAEQVAREIGAGLLVTGERLPAERQMAADYGVAVGTLRKSLALLEDRGLLQRRQGSGNYIQAGNTRDSLYSFFRLELPGGGGLPRAQLLSVKTLDKPGDLPDFGSSDRAHRFRRLRYLDDVPAALEEIWLDASVTPAIDAEQVSESLYYYYKERLGLWIARAEDWVGLGLVPDWRVDQFPRAPESPCGFVERFGWTQEGKKIEYSRNWFDPDRVRYVARLK